MTEGKHVLLVTDRNVLVPGGEWRLIATRADALYEEFGIRTRIVVVRPAIHMDDPIPQHMTSRAVTVEFMDIFRPGRFHSGLQGLVRAHNPMQIATILSGTAVLYGARFTHQSMCPVFVDLHGDIAEWKEHPPRLLGREYLGKALFPVVQRLNEWAVRRAAGALTVSSPLQSVAMQSGAKQAFRVPCTLRGWPSQEQKREFRREYRAQWGVDDESSIWIYAGGTSEWQMLDQTVLLFSRIATLDPTAHFVIATHDSEAVSTLLTGFAPWQSRLRVTSLHPDDVVPALCAADVGVMLRAPSLTNASAFPNKFMEYVAAGLFVVTGQGLRDPATLIDKYDLGVALDAVRMQDVDDQMLLDIVQRVRDHQDERWTLSRALLDEVDYRRTLVPFVESLSLRSDSTSG